MRKLIYLILLLPLLSCAQQGVSIRATNGVAWNLSVSNHIVRWATNISAANPYAHQYPNFNALIFGTNNGSANPPWDEGSIAVPNDFKLYDRIGNYIWFWSSHSGQNTFGTPTDGLLLLNGARDVDILLGPNGGCQLGRTGNSYNGTFYLQYNENTGPNSAQLQWRANRADSDRAYPGIVGRHEATDSVAHGHLDFYARSPTWNTYPSGGFSAPGTLTMTANEAGLQVLKTMSNNWTVSYLKLSSGSTAYSPNYGGIDNSWGLYTAHLVGGDINNVTRTSGQSKFSGMAMCPVVTGNPMAQISQYVNSGSTLTINYGGNTGGGGGAAAFQHSFWAHTDSTSVSSGTEHLRITSANGVSILTKLSTSGTVTAGGTTGNQTINKPSGTVNFAAAATTLTVNCDKVTATSIVFAVVQTADATATIKNVVPAAGSFVINLGAAATAETKVGFLVVNPI